MPTTLIRRRPGKAVPGKIGSAPGVAVTALLAAGLALAVLGGVVLVLPFLLAAVPTRDPAAAVRWYGTVTAEEGWRLAARNSLAVGAGAALLATVAGTAAALAFRFGHVRGVRPVAAGVVLLAALPSACAAVVLLAILEPLGWAGRFRGLVLAHALLGVPLVTVTVLLALRPLGRSALRTAASLGAPPGMLLGNAVLPLAWPGIAAGGLLAFAASLGDAVLSGLLAPVGQPTLAPRVLAGLRGAPGPDTWAVGTLLLLLCLLLAGCAARLVLSRLRLVSRGREVG